MRASAGDGKSLRHHLRLHLLSHVFRALIASRKSRRSKLTKHAESRETMAVSDCVITGPTPSASTSAKLSSFANRRQFAA